MTNRERWIVYPLLFLSIGLGLRNGFELKSPFQDVELVNAEKVVCKTLLIVAGSGAADDVKPMAAIGTDDEGRSGVLETFDRDGRKLAVLSATPAGGLLTLFDSQSRNVLIAGYEGRIIGLALGQVVGNEFLPIAMSPWLTLRPTGQTSPEQPKQPATDDSKSSPGSETPSVPQSGENNQPAAPQNPEETGAGRSTK